MSPTEDAGVVLADRILEMATRFYELESLDPDIPGIDELGNLLWRLSTEEHLSEVVENALRNVEERRPGCLRLLRGLSMRSHFRLEIATLRHARSLMDSGKLELSLSTEDRLAKLLERYPYGWASPRTVAQIAFLRDVLAVQLDANDTIVIAGGAGLPLTALYFYLCTRARIIVLDCDAEGVLHARQSVQLFERAGIIPSGALSIEMCFPGDPNPLPLNLDVSFALVNDVLIPRELWITSLSKYVRTIGAMSASGLAQLSYPALNMAYLRDNGLIPSWVLTPPTGDTLVPASAGIGTLSSDCTRLSTYFFETTSNSKTTAQSIGQSSKTLFSISRYPSR